MKSIRTRKTNKMNRSAALTAAFCLGALGVACEPPPDGATGAPATASEASALRSTTSGEPPVVDDAATSTRATRPLPPQLTPSIPIPPPLAPTEVSHVTGDQLTVNQTLVFAPPPADPPPPAHQVCGKLVRISSEQLDDTLGAFLRDTTIVYDTTGTSVPITGQKYVCGWPNHLAHQAALDACHELPKSTWAECGRQADEDFPDEAVCAFTPAQFHSYIHFGPFAEGAEDELFDSDTIVRDTSTGEATFDINFVHTTVSLGTLTSSFTNDASTGRANASMSLLLSSNDPTISCTYWTGCPGIELSDMRIDAQLVGISPMADNTQLGFDRADVAFSFQSNVEYVPDAIVELFVDVDGLIKNRVKSTLEKALNKDKSRAALNKALTKLVKSFASYDVQSFYDAWFENGSLVVDYQPANDLASISNCVKIAAP